ncbi:MBL fold metallo-hydrolase [Phenylobacterium sp.]|uniref:MBL fold metallo-hydrolase n=1 Tax=Phenylobacterium sp. TaxID=1871053 RepID=UPI0035B02B02
MRAIASALAAAVLALVPLAACQAAGPPPPQPQATAFKVGSLELYALRDAQFMRPNDGTLFPGHAAEAVAELLKAAGDAPDAIPLSVDALLVKTPDRLVLIDTGVGGVLQASLAKAGFSPDQVTDILITHTHGDHVGGLVKDGALAFPKATIRMSAPEWAWMQTKTAQADLVKAIAPRVKTFEPGAAVLPAVTAVPIAGHTPGHTGYEIVSDGQRLLDIGDTAHSSIVSLAHPDWPIEFDTDKAVGAKSRMAELKTLSESHETLFAPHFPYPGVGQIEAAGGGYAFKPTVKAAQ